MKDEGFGCWIMVTTHFFYPPIILQIIPGPVEKVLKDAGKGKSDIDEIVLVGGSTRIPKIQSLLSDDILKLIGTKTYPLLEIRNCSRNSIEADPLKLR